MSGLYDFIAVFVQSDVAGPSPNWWHWINAQSSHAILSAFVATIFPRWWFAFIASWIAKELFGDIPNGGWSGLVMLDSVADLFAAYIGFRLVGPKMLDKSAKTM